MATREKDVNWTLAPLASGSFSFDSAQLAVLMDLRDELKQLNRILSCPNAVAIPRYLRDIRRNTTPRVRIKRVKR